jgi:hypothetical protein
MLSPTKRPETLSRGPTGQASLSRLSFLEKVRRLIAQKDVYY